VFCKTWLNVLVQRTCNANAKNPEEKAKRYSKSVPKASRLFWISFGIEVFSEDGETVSTVLPIITANMPIRRAHPYGGCVGQGVTP